MMLIRNMFAPEGDKGLCEDCAKCKTHEKCKTPYMDYIGEGKLNCLIIGESPSMTDDDAGVPLSGSDGRFLKRRLSKLGLRLEEDFWITNAIICKPQKNKPPTDRQLKLCRRNLIETIEELQPRFIWTFGSIASKAVIQKGLKKVSVSSLTNRMIPLNEYDAWLMPMFDPKYLIRNENDRNLQQYYLRNLKNVLDFMKEDPDLPCVNPFDKITFLRTPDEIEDLINKLIDDGTPSSFDFESTGLYPWIEGHKTTSMAIATEEMSYAFPIQHPEAKFTHEEEDLVIDSVCYYLESKKLEKIGHNVNFDKRWAYWALSADPEGFFPCSMVASHILDHRNGNNSLKDQAFLRWGIVNYDKATEGYIKQVPGTLFNRMTEMPLDEQLLYVGADAKLTIKTYLEQCEEFTKGQESANAFFIDSLVPLLDIQNNGILIDVPYFEQVARDLAEEIEEIEEEINKSDDAERYPIIYKEPFNYSSPNCLKRILFEMNDVEAVKFTGKGNESVDEEALGKIDYWMCKEIVKVRKLKKLKDTYISQYLRGECDGVVHPEFPLHTVTSFRSSCCNPNIQNTPKRNKKSKKLIRSGFITPRQWKVFELDFSGIEVSTSAMYHKDPGFMEYLFTPGTDMHRDVTCDLWMLPTNVLLNPEYTKEQKELAGILRFFGKNLWTFAQFYGDYFGSCGENLWKICLFEEKLVLPDGTLLKDWIFDQGITELGTMHKGQPTPGSFLAHCKEVENKMWNERFPIYTQWKKDINDFYNEHGYTESLLGFRFDGYMDRKQTTNYLIQGTAFHLLMWCLARVNERLKKEKWESYLIGEVHDSMIGYVHPAEEQDLWPMMKKICTVDVVKKFPFINVPLGIEIETSEPDGNFANLTEIEI